MNQQSKDLYDGQGLPQHRQQPLSLPSLMGYAANGQQQNATLYQQQQQNFQMWVLLLQKELQAKQQQRQQMQTQRQGQWQPQQTDLPHQISSQAHTQQRPPVALQSPLLQINNNTITNNSTNPLPSAQSTLPQKLEQNKQQHQKQSYPQTRMWNEAVAALVRNAELSRKRKLLDTKVLNIRMERKSLQQPWGLGFVSMNQNQYVANSNSKQNGIYTAITDILFGKRIIVVKSPNSRILPGDMMLEIDGIPISSWCVQDHDKAENTTASIASYLRNIRNVSIVVLRHSDAVSAVAVPSNELIATPQHHDPCRVASIANAAWNRLLIRPPPTKTKKLKSKPIVIYRNPWFWHTDASGTKVFIPYADNQGTLEHELFSQQDGSRASLFLSPIPFEKNGFCNWLNERKNTWRKTYKVHRFANEAKKAKREAKPSVHKNKEKIDEDSDIVTNVDFWTSQGFSSFDDWLRTRSIQWHRSYSWNRLKRQRIEEECFEKVVALPLTNQQSPSCSAEEFHEWLHARRVQWKMSRRKRKRQRLSIQGEKPDVKATDTLLSDSPRCVTKFEESGKTTSAAKRKLQFGSEEDQQLAYIDEILEEKERERQEALRKRRERPPIDILRFCDATKGIPDDVVAHCFGYLDSTEHAKLFLISRPISRALEDRHGVWQMLCPNHWILPRRPRKPWHEIYLTRLRKERESHQKRWDDLLIKCSSALFKRDDLQKIEKLITKAEKEFGFDLNYSSGVVCERNSILNLAVIHGRYKVVRWLVDTKHADIETSDRGNFTPLLNAAWSGDRWLVRFFLQRRCNRDVVGTQHYTQGIAPPGFEGKTAEGWAEHRGHPEIAKLIKLGL